MTRLFLDNIDDADNSIILDKDNSHYIMSVLRMREGEQLIVVPVGTGDEILAEVAELNKEQVVLKQVERRKNMSEPPVRITLYQSVSKGERMDLTIQKSVELGVSKIVPVFSERCVVKQEKKSNKTDRWQKIALEAARQSGRGIVPEVAESMTYKEALADSKDRQFVLFPWEEEHGKTLKQAVEGKDLVDVGVFIGPEGGFSEGEAQMAAENGAVRVTLGPRILRTETAGPAVLAMLLYQMEL